MKTGIFSDVHGNLEALEAVLGTLAREGTKRLFCLGDLVGYCANPNECVARVRQAAEVVVLGNHDAACVGADEIVNFNQYAREAVLWTMHHLSEENRDWLKGLPLTESREETLLVHASPFEPAGWHYIHTRTRTGEIIRGFAATTARLAFVGHSHQPLIYVKKGEELYRFLGSHLKLEEDCRYLINVGSAGQPRDGNPRVSFAIHDSDAGTITILRADYDIVTTQRKIREAGLPEILANRLETGS